MLGPVRPLFQTIFQVARDLAALIASAMRSRAQLAAENLFLRKQLALYLEREVKPHRPREIWKIVEDYDGDTYRAVYTAAFPDVVYVLDVFMKKSKSGIKTPQMDKDRVRDRFKAAKRDYDANYRQRGGQ